MIIHHFYSIYFKGNNLFLHNNNYLHEVLLSSVYFTNALNGPVVIDGFSKHCGQESHVNGMNQSHNGTEGCVHCDVYTVNSQLTYGVARWRHASSPPPINEKKRRHQSWWRTTPVATKAWHYGARGADTRARPAPSTGEDEGCRVSLHQVRTSSRYDTFHRARARVELSFQFLFHYELY